MKALYLVALAMLAGCGDQTATRSGLNPRGSSPVLGGNAEQLPVLSTANRDETVALLVIAVEDRDPRLDSLHLSQLKCVLNDGRAIVDVFKDVLRVPEDNIVLLENQEATTHAVFHQIDRLTHNIRDGDSIVVVLLGHGLGSNATESRFVFYDQPTPVSDFLKKLSKLSTNRVLLILDACRSGKPYSDEFVINATNMQRDGTVAWISSAKADEQAYEDVNQLNHGVFTHFLVESLRNCESLDSRKDGWLDLEEIGVPLQHKVLEWVRTARGDEHLQTPQFELLRARGATHLLPIPRRWGLKVIKPQHATEVAVNVPTSLQPSHTAWVLVAPINAPGLIWPQARLDATPVNTVTVYLGEPNKGVGEQFRIILVDADPELDRYFQTQRPNNSGHPCPDSRLQIRAEETVTRPY